MRKEGGGMFSESVTDKERETSLIKQIGGLKGHKKRTKKNRSHFSGT